MSMFSSRKLAFLNLREYEFHNHASSFPGKLDKNIGIFEMYEPYPENLKFIEEIDLNVPEHACNQEIKIPRRKISY